MALQTTAPKAWLVLLILFAAMSVALKCIFSIIDPPQYDALYWAYIGEKWLQGDIPYRDMFELKSPGIFVVTGLGAWLFPGNLSVLSLMEGVFIFGGIMTCYVLMRQISAPLDVAVLGAACCAVTVNLLFYNTHGFFTETFALWPAVLSMLFFARALLNARTGEFLLAGLFSGLAALFKLPGLSPLLAQFTFVIFLYLFGQMTVSRSLRLIGHLLAGAGIAWLPFLLYFSWYKALDEFLFQAVIYPFYYGAGSHPSLYRTVFLLITRLKPVGGLVVAGMLSCLWVFSSRAWARSYAPGKPLFTQNSSDGPYRWGLLLTFWVLFDLLGAMAGGRYYPHYFILLMASLSITASLLYWFVLIATPPVGSPRLRTAVIMLILVPLLFWQASEAADTLKLLRAKTSKAEKSGHVLTLPRAAGFNCRSSKCDEALKIAAHLKLVSEPGHSLFVWDYEPIIYFTTGIKHAYRQLTAANAADSESATRHLGGEILRDTRNKPATFIVDRKKTEGELHRLANARYVYDKFRSNIDVNYKAIYQTQNFTLYRAHEKR